MSRVLFGALPLWALLALPLPAQDWPGGPVLRLPPVDEPIRVAQLAPPTAPQNAVPTPTPAAEAIPAGEVIAVPDGSPLEDQQIIWGDAGWGFWGSDYWDPWEGNVELGLSGTEGNTQTFNVRLGILAKHKTDTFVRTLQITSIQKSADGETTANTALFDSRLEWPMPQSRFNYFIHGLIEYDQFKAFDYRLSGDTGFGYEFIQNDVTTLIGRTGLSVSHEIGGPDDTTRPELLFGGEYKHKFNDTHSISAKADYYPDVTDFSVFRLNSQASWEIVLAASWGLSLKLSIIDRYDSRPLGKRPNDLDYSTLVLWSF